MADNVLYMGVRGVTDLMVAPGLVNLDFADIRTVMAEMGKAMMGTGEADGENRAIRAAEVAISNPLLEDTSMAGARGLLINITGGEDMTLFEVDQAANRIREEVDEEANIIFGSAIDESLGGKIRVSVVATGIESPAQKAAAAERPRLVAVGGGAPMPMPAAMAQAAASGAHAGTGQASASASAQHSMPGGQPTYLAPQPGSAFQPTALRPAPLPKPLPLARLQAAAAQHAAQLAAAQQQPRSAPAAAPPAHAGYEAAPDDFAEGYDAPHQPEALGQALPAAARQQPPSRSTSRFAGGQQSGRSGLFAEPKQTEPAALAPARPSLFKMMTGAILGAHAAPSHAADQPAQQTDPAARAEPSLHAGRPGHAHRRAAAERRRQPGAGAPD